MKNKPQPLTKAQEIFGKALPDSYGTGFCLSQDHGNASILNERPTHLRSRRRQQTKVIKNVLR